MAFEFDEKNREEIKNIMKQVIDESKPKETDDQRRARIMSIKDPVRRQQQIEENIDLFKERLN